MPASGSSVSTILVLPSSFFFFGVELEGGVMPTRMDAGGGRATAWNVRAIWETYAGWFHHRSTTELYAVPQSEVAADIVGSSGAPGLRSAAWAHVDAGRPVHAIHLTDLLLAADADDAAARAIAVAAHEALLAESTNFWESAWLRKQLGELNG